MTDQHNQDPYETAARLVLVALVALSWIAATAASVGAP